MYNRTMKLLFTWLTSDNAAPPHFSGLTMIVSSFHSVTPDIITCYRDIFTGFRLHSQASLRHAPLPQKELLTAESRFRTSLHQHSHLPAVGDYVHTSHHYHDSFSIQAPAQTLAKRWQRRAELRTQLPLCQVTFESTAQPQICASVSPSRKF